MKNPINKRIIRLLLKNFSKYFPIFLLMTLTIVVCSSFYIVQGSIKELYYENLRESKVEDGQFTVINKLDEKVLSELEKEDIKIYDNFYIEEKFDKEKLLRIFENRENINIQNISRGKIPESEDEIAISNTMAKLNDFKIGQEIVLNNKYFKIVGFFSVPDYNTSLKSRADIVMDNKAFSIGLVSKYGFKELNTKKIKYNYSYHSNRELDKIKANEKIEDLYKIASKDNIVTDYTTRFDNKCITYLMDDMGGDVPMMTTLMVIVLISYAFIFTVQAKALVEEESTVIGTLLASGYKKSEMISHYMTIPITITVFSSVIGNLLAYTKFYKIYIELYYRSFNLPEFKVIFNMNAFILTTFIPVLIMISVNYLMLYFKLKNSPLKFLRNEIRSAKNRNSHISLENFKFLRKFKFRVILENKLNILSLFFGLFIANILLIFGLSFVPIFNNYAVDIKNEMQYNYINIVKIPEKVIKNVDKGLIYNLEVKLEKTVSIQFYGVEKASKYSKIGEIDSLAENEVIISDGFANRYNLGVDDEIECFKSYSDKNYKLKVKGILKEIKSVSAYMPLDKLNDLLENQKGYYNAYFSDDKLNISEENIITTIDKETVDKFLFNFLDQFKVIKNVLLVVSISFYTIFLAILSKLIIEKSRVNISYLKIFGYSSSEISKIYINSIRNFVFIYLIFLMFFMDYFVRFLIRLSMKKLDVYINPKIPFCIYPAVVLVGIFLYILVQFVYSKKISRMNMVEGLKNING